MHNAVNSCVRARVRTRLGEYARKRKLRRVREVERKKKKDRDLVFHLNLIFSELLEKKSPYIL